MSDLENKKYVLSIISRIDIPENSDLIRLIEHIDVTEKSVKIIINSEMKRENKMITDQWQRFIEKDNQFPNRSNQLTLLKGNLKYINDELQNIIHKRRTTKYK